MQTQVDGPASEVISGAQVRNICSMLLIASFQRSIFYVTHCSCCQRLPDTRQKFLKCQRKTTGTNGSCALTRFENASGNQSRTDQPGPQLSHRPNSILSNWNRRNRNLIHCYSLPHNRPHRHPVRTAALMHRHSSTKSTLVRSDVRGVDAKRYFLFTTRLGHRLSSFDAVSGPTMISLSKRGVLAPPVPAITTFATTATATWSGKRMLLTMS